ncbi:stress-induced protein 1 isoform X2 [Diorhabda carinulata]|uniref:stress-induced protein 1 isoform X2 n=1 Tax=Diorhabda sublineata TaxID=1163346 RepID=UPI0024E05487|nr:stress-induced protein 1 isoform X2 [Diorhabda sublineata]XP_057661241.1 stress-induced protein 1 isoform X2 [Diorhabda carinulata]
MANRNIPIKMGDFSVIDTEFSSIRERFDAEMRKMEEEMNKFRSELTSREANNFFRSTTRSYECETLSGGNKSTSTTSSTTQQTSTGSDLAHRSPGGGDVRTWYDDLNSPLIQQDGNEKSLKLRFDVSQYAPEEIVVKTVDNKLLVHAKHEEKTESKSVYREYNREFLLPKGTNPEHIKSSLSKDGVLTVEAPLPAITAGEKLIPIQH